MSRVINISQDDFDLVRSYLGFPAVNNIILDDTKIADLCIYPALLKYFEFFPIEERYEQIAFQMVTVPYPPDAFGIIDARFVGKDGFGTNRSSSTFLDIVRFQAMGQSGMTKGSFGTNYGFGGLEFQWMSNKMLRNSLTNNSETFKIYNNKSKKQLEVFSSMKATLNVTWAKASNNFNDVQFLEKMRVIDLAASYLLKNLKNVGSIMEDNDTTKKLNIAELKETADQLETKVLEYWQAIPHIFIQRG